MTQIKSETDRLIIRDYHRGDIERVHIYTSIKEFSQFELWGPNTMKDTKKFVLEMAAQSEDRERYKFDAAICLKETGALVGGCGIRRESQSSCIASLGWMINPEFQKRGLATEASERLMRFGFDNLKLRVI